jgi:hypothetical protein
MAHGHSSGEADGSLDSQLADRKALLRALSDACAQERSRSLLVVARVDLLSTPAPSKHLLETAGWVLLRLGGAGARVYRARRGEFCLVLSGDLARHRRLLDSIEPRVAAEAGMPGLRAAVGAVVVPDEASSAAAALTLAQTRLQSSSAAAAEQKAAPAAAPGVAAAQLLATRSWLPGPRTRRSR